MSQRALKALSLAFLIGPVAGACGGGSDKPNDTACPADGICDGTCTPDPDCTSGTGGVATGGGPALGGTGGSQAGGTGALPTGGGGALPTGGGGALPTGGVGAIPTGGGGAAPTGGAAGTTGGSSGSGGAPTGGTAGSGGAMPTGGTAGTTGGGGTAPTGGVGTGGVSLTLPLLVTSANGAYWTTPGTLTEVSGATANVTVDTGSSAQTWEGFCGAFNEMGWDFLSMLSEAERVHALELLFGADGCHFTWGRIPIGSSDYGMDRYTLDEVASGETDPDMSEFSIDRDLNLLIPFIKAAQEVRSDIRFWASPWTPPTWMKDGPFNDEYPFDGGSMKGDATTLGALAQYFVRFVQGYAEQGIDIELVSPQNEPGYSGTYPTCAWAPETYRDFIGLHLGPALAGASLDVGVMVGTFNGGTGDTNIISTTMNDPTASSYVTVLGYQWGMVSNVGADQKYGVPVWQSEHQCGNYPWLGGFVDTVAPNDHAYAVESWGLIRDWIRAGVTSYGTWNMVLDTVGNGIDSQRFWPQNALLTVDTSALSLNITPTYYVFRHFSQFVEPGATVVGTGNADAVAFRNPDGTIVTVMYNSGGATTYVLSVGGTSLQFDMPGDGWATVVVE